MDIVKFIKELTQETEVLVVTETEVKMNKKDVETKSIANPYVGATKRSAMRVRVNPQYEKAVNEQRESEGKEGDFQSQGRAWGTNVGNGIIEHNGKVYVSCIVESSVGTEYYFDGQEIEKSLLKPFIKESAPSTNQGTEKQIVYRTIDISNIKEFEVL